MRVFFAVAIIGKVLVLILGSRVHLFIVRSSNLEVTFRIVLFRAVLYRDDCYKSDL